MNVNYTQYTELLTTAKNQLSSNPDCIIGLSRGGLIPAVELSHYFDVPLLVADISHPESVGDNKGSHKNIVPVLEPNYINIMIVDDILDSGNTVNALINELLANYKVESIKVVSLFHKSNAVKYIANTFDETDIDFVTGKIIAEDHPFIYFPWEQQPVVTNNEEWDSFVSNKIMDVVEMLGNYPKTNVDPRAWTHLKVYMPTNQEPLAWQATYMDKNGTELKYTTSIYELAVENDRLGSPTPLYTKY